MSTERQFLFVGGEWIKPASSKRIEVINATTEEVIGSVPGVPITIAEQLESGYCVGVLRDYAGRAAVAAYQQLKSIYLMG